MKNKYESRDMVWIDKEDFGHWFNHTPGKLLIKLINDSILIFPRLQSRVTSSDHRYLSPLEIKQFMILFVESNNFTCNTDSVEGKYKI